jgi:hypothetical protein
VATVRGPSRTALRDLQGNAGERLEVENVDIARLTTSDSIPNLVSTVDAQRGRAGVQYLDNLGHILAW